MAEDRKLEDGQDEHASAEQQNGHHDEPGEQDPLMVNSVTFNILSVSLESHLPIKHGFSHTQTS